jgi:lipopolysaccharide transport system permease protein
VSLFFRAGFGTLYLARSFPQRGDIMRRMFGEIWQLRFFCVALAQHDLKERYRRSILGIAWSLLKPAAMTFILTAIFSNVFNVSVLEYGPFLFLGIVTWQFLSESITQGCSAFRLGATHLRLRPVPMAIFPLRVALSAGTHALIALIGVAFFLGGMQGWPAPLALLSLLLALAILLVAAWSLACIAAILHTIFSDTQQIAEISLQALFYATPIIYTPESLRESGWLSWIVQCNPFAALLELVRQPLLHGAPPSGTALVVSLMFAMMLATIACLGLRSVERRLVLWL